MIYGRKKENVMNYKEQGEITELRFYLKAFEEGFVVSKPFGDNQRYDFIVDKNGKLSRVQIKSVGVQDKYDRGGKYRINASFGASRKYSYSSNEIDILVVYIIPMEVWYIIPVNEISNIKTLGFRPHKSSRARLEVFKDRWDLFN